MAAAALVRSAAAVMDSGYKALWLRSFMYSMTMPDTQTLLVVDDDSSMHELVQAMLQDTEWEVDCAQDGEEALERVNARAYDLVLTDILMPGMDGLTLLSRLRERHPQTRVVVMTIRNTSDHILGSLRRDAAGYVSKPFTREALIMALREALSRPLRPGRYSGSLGPAAVDFAANSLQGRHG